MGDFRERIGLVHELGELARTEELVHHGRDRLCVHQVVGHHGLQVLQAHLLLDGPLHADEPDAVLVFDELAHGTDAAVAQVVDVVDAAVSLAELEVDQVLDGLEDVGLAKGRHVDGHVEPQLVVHLHAAHVRDVVGLGVEEEALEEPLCRLRGGRVRGTEPAVDLDDGLVARFDLVDEQRLHDGGVGAVLVEVDELHLLDALLLHEIEAILREFLIAAHENFARGGIHDVAGEHPAREVVLADGDPLDLELVHPLEGELRDLAALLHDDLAALGLRLDVLGGLLVGHEGTHVEPDLPILEGDLLDGVEIVEDILRRVAHGL